VKVIFLDIDGVINSMSGLYMRGGQSVMDLYVEHIQVLKWILDKTDARIVISSTWRIGMTVEELKRMFYNYGLPSRYIIDKTPRFTGEQRGFEIKHWLDNCDVDVESFVVLDDDNDMDVVRDNFVQTKHDYGLTYVEGHKAVEMLNGKEKANEDFHNEMMENEK
jgi:hypothetical protein